MVWKYVRLLITIRTSVLDNTITIDVTNPINTNSNTITIEKECKEDNILLMCNS
jgi:hypothetical protein